MIIGTGIDIVEIERAAIAYAKFGIRFARKILHANELATLPPKPAFYLASRFAAKEATVKALGCGFSLGVAPIHIEVATSELGKPMLILHGPALDRARQIGALDFQISLSHERKYAIAMVILED